MLSSVAKLYLSVAILIFWNIHWSYALKCYHCEDEDKCKNESSLIECNRFLATVGNYFLSQYYKDVQTIKITSPDQFDCVTHNFTSELQNSFFKTCAFAELKVCNLTLLDHLPSNRNISCKTCNYNECNSSNTFRVDQLTLLFSPLFILLMKYYK